MGAFTLAIGRDGATLRGVAADASTTYAAFAMGGSSTKIEARDGRRPLWELGITGATGPIARTGGFVVAALGGTGRVTDLELRGQPGAVVVAVPAAGGGGPAWRLAIDSSEWATIAAIAPDDELTGAIVGGSFSGTLRAGSHVVSSAGKSDGFVAKVTGNGEVAWLVRLGGPGADGVQGVAGVRDRIAITGTFAAGADLQGEPLKAYDEKSPYADGFVAELDGRGVRRWSATFGGKSDDSVAGVAIDGKGRVAVAASAREVVYVGGTDLIANGAADGLVAWWSADGTAGPAVLIGGSDVDGLRGIAAVGDRVVVAGVFSGSISLGDRALTAGGGDDAFFAALDGATIVEAWPVGGEGREEIVAIAPVTGGVRAFVAGVTHTASANIDGASLPAPGDPMSGAAIVVRPVR